MCPNEKYYEEGFTLIEVLVAMMILAVSLSMVMQLFSQGLRSGSLSRQYVQGVYYAQARMEETLFESEGGLVSGEGVLPDGYKWRVIVEPLRDSISESAYLNYQQLYSVIVEVSWWAGRQQKSIILQTLHFGSKSEENSPED